MLSASGGWLQGLRSLSGRHPEKAGFDPSIDLTIIVLGGSAGEKQLISSRLLKSYFLFLN